MTRSRPNRGSAVVELALGSGVLMAMFAGTFQFGYTVLQYNRLQNAVALGARYASMLPYDSASATPSAAFVNAVANMAVSASPQSGAAPVVPGLTPQNIQVTVAFQNRVPAAITVAVSAHTIDGLFGKVTLSGKPRATFPYQGVWAPY